MVFAYLSFGLSSVVILVCEGVAIVLIAIVGVVVLAHGGYHHHHALSSAPFHSHGTAFSVLVLGLGVVNAFDAFDAFSAFEGAATLGEESVRGRRTIPAAVAGSLLASAGVYIVFTCIIDNAYATPTALAADPAPRVHLANGYVGPAMGKLVNLAGVISAFGARLACINAANRLLFSFGREAGGRGASELLVRTSRRFGSPIGALTVTGTASVAAIALTWQRGRRPAPMLILTIGAGGGRLRSAEHVPPAPDRAVSNRRAGRTRQHAPRPGDLVRATIPSLSRNISAARRHARTLTPSGLAARSVGCYD